MKTRPFLLHALSPLHAGTGQSVEVIDLPIARMTATGFPFLPGSSIKGVLRWTRGEKQGNHSDKELLAVFGPNTDNASDFAGALVVSDARLLALPVRSFVGTFAWVTCPLLLSLALRDLRTAEATQWNPVLPLRIPKVQDFGTAAVAKDSLNLQTDKVYLQDLDLKARVDDDVMAWANFLSTYLMNPEEKALFIRRFMVVDDESMSYLCQAATQVDARIRLDVNTRTVADGALWYEESLPPETLLIGLLMATDSFDKSSKDGKSVSRKKAQEVLDFALQKQPSSDAAEVLQFGGKATVGRGRTRMIALV